MNFDISTLVYIAHKTRAYSGYVLLPPGWMEYLNVARFASALGVWMKSLEGLEKTIRANSEVVEIKTRMLHLQLTQD